MHAGLRGALHADATHPVVPTVWPGNPLHQLSACLHHPTLPEPNDLWLQRRKVPKVLDGVPHPEGQESEAGGAVTTETKVTAVRGNFTSTVLCKHLQNVRIMYLKQFICLIG